jgi:hypothetical protein
MDMMLVPDGKSNSIDRIIQNGMKRQVWAVDRAISAMSEPIRKPTW